MPYLIPDDPIVRSMERTGLPPWQLMSNRNGYGSGFGYDPEEFWEEGDDGDVYWNKDETEG